MNNIKCYINKIRLKRPAPILIYNHDTNEVIEEHVWSQYSTSPRSIGTWLEINLNRKIDKLPHIDEWIDVYDTEADIPDWQRKSIKFPAITMREFKKNCPGAGWN